jgi:hypothetical protein
MAEIEKSALQKNQLLEVVDTAGIAEYTLRIARDLVMNGIGGNGCDVDELTVISCTLDRVTAHLRESIAIADKMRKAQCILEAKEVNHG